MRCVLVVAISNILFEFVWKIPFFNSMWILRFPKMAHASLVNRCFVAEQNILNRTSVNIMIA